MFLKMLLLSLLLVCFTQESVACGGGGGGGGCGRPVNCVWGSWGQWATCSNNRESRTRRKSTTERCNGYCFGQSSQYRTCTSNNRCNVVAVKRSEWGAKAPKSVASMKLPVNRLFIHHGATNTPCYSQAECSRIVRSYQNTHMAKGYDDIGYNYLIGEDGRVYEGRGWNREGAHTKANNSKGVSFNKLSVAICFIGDFTSRLPNQAALTTARNLIQCAKNQGVLTSDYIVCGHKDVKSTDCPGATLYNLIKNWDDYGSQTECRK